MDNNELIGRRTRRGGGRSHSHVSAGCRKLAKMGREKKRFNKKQRALFWAEHTRHCKEPIECSVCGFAPKDAKTLFLCESCLDQVYCSKECQEKDVNHYNTIN